MDDELEDFFTKKEMIVKSGNKDYVKEDDGSWTQVGNEHKKRSDPFSAKEIFKNKK